MAAVRWWAGSQGWSHGSTPLGMLMANLTQPAWLFYAFVFFGVLWVIPFLGWRRWPRELRYLAVVMLPYLGLQMLFGRIREVRLLLPSSLVLIPMFLLYIREAYEGQRDEGEA